MNGASGKIFKFSPEAKSSLHKAIQNTMKYTQLVHFKDDEFQVATATTIEEAKQLLAAGFDYATEKNDIMLFRRPKRFGG